MVPLALIAGVVVVALAPTTTLRIAGRFVLVIDQEHEVSADETTMRLGRRSNAVLLGLATTATVRTQTPCTLLSLDRAACERHILSQPGVREAFSQLIAERLGRTARLFSGQEWQEGDLRV